MFTLIRRILFLLPPERAHYATMHLLQALCAFAPTRWFLQQIWPMVHDPVEIVGISFPNRVGLAAGFDKDARFMRVFKTLGFGHMEIGTITPKAQPGNEKPRLFRLPADKALINRLGFNNMGLDHAIEKLKNRPEGLIIGGNIGKNKVTPNEQAQDDYVKCFEGLFPYVDYFTVNVSSPNTPNLRALQEKEPLMALLSALQERNSAKSTPKPIFLKIAPDLTEGQLDDIVDIVKSTNIAGVVATNTTIDRSGLNTPSTEVESWGAGGLSGAPVFVKSTHILKQLHEKSGGSFPIIGVGGVVDASTAQSKAQAGAQLVQLYTGFIYAGPSLVNTSAQALKRYFKGR